MTPEQEQKLDSLLDSVGDIKVACKPCTEIVKAHDVILHGPPENGRNPGLITRLAKVVESNEKMEQGFLVQARWFRRYLGAAVAALLAVVYAVIEYFMTNGTS